MSDRSKNRHPTYCLRRRIDMSSLDIRNSKGLRRAKWVLLTHGEGGRRAIRLHDLEKKVFGKKSTHKKSLWKLC